jgi:hypothetical protein
LAAEALRLALPEVRPDVIVRELPPPTRLAPYALALDGELERAGDAVASGRFVLLVDPAGQAAWDGVARFVCFARAEVDPEMAGDPVLPEVAWAWLREALEARGAHHHAIGGTVTATTSRRFGALARDGDSHDLELRCAWSPRWTDTIWPGHDPIGYSAEAAAHLHAFAELVAAMAGVPPRSPDVVPLAPGRL